MNRRKFIKNLTLATTAIALTPALARVGNAQNGDNKNLPKYEEWQLSDAEWQKRLTAKEYKIMRNEGTEPAYSNSMESQTTAGTYHCAACSLPAYSSKHKFESGTGWPSFYQPIVAEHVATKTDWKLFYPRQEVHCARCGSHQGHVFKDGPKPTGLRYCINSVSLKFTPA